jgi:CheY-like chemotaxis protein
LTIVLGSQARLAEMTLPAEARPHIDATLAAARRGGTLLERLSQLTGARDWRPEPCATEDFLADLDVLARAALPGGVTLTIRNALPGERLMLDPGLLQDALLNLILNARDACGPEGRIGVTLSALQGTWAEFAVTDTGPGFSDAALHRGFEPFYTTKGAEGSGLGLAMVYDMAKLAGGRVVLGNTFSGARVALRLPLRTAPAEAAGRLVLMVEDSAEVRATIRDMLTELGHAVAEAASAAEARTLLETLPEIGAVLTDLTLEGEETGLDLAESLGPGGPPVWIMTALPADDPRHQAARARWPVLAKPFSAAHLAQTLDAGRAA